MATKAELLKAFPEDIKNHIANFKAVSFEGLASAGPVTATGLKVGDVVLAVVGLTAGALGDVSASFQQKITVVNQIQQTGTGMNLKYYIAIVI